MAWFLNIWSDEASTLYTTGSGIATAIERAGDEKQAPLYFILMSAWRLIDDSIFFARLFSVFVSVASIASFYILVRKIWIRDVAFVATLLFAIHPYMIWASTEIRVYSVVILFTLVLTILFERGFLRYKKTTFRYRNAFTVLALIAFCMNYYLGFFLVALFISLLAIKHYKSSLDYLLRMLGVLVLLAPLFLLIRYQLGADIDGRVFVPDFVGGLRQVWNHLLTFVLPTEMFPPEDQTVFSFVRVWVIRVILLISVTILLVKRKMPQRVFILFGVQIAVLLGFFLLANQFVGVLYIEIRHAAVFFVPTMMFLIAAVLEFRKSSRWKNVYFGVLVLLLVSFYIYGITAIYPNGVKRGDWDRVASFVEQNETKGQAVIVFRTYKALAFKESYNGVNPVLPDEQFVDWYYEGERGTEEMWPKQQKFVLAKIPSDAKEIWYVTEEVCFETEACSILENHIEQNYTVVKQKDFFKGRVRLLRKK